MLARVGVGTDGQVLTADAASTPGVKWVAPSTTDVLAVHQGDLVVNVKDYGATGDGSTDDRAAIVAADTAAAAANKALYFPGNQSTVYRISSTINVDTGRVWLSNWATIKPTDSFTSTDILAIIGSDVHIDRLTVDGNKAFVPSGKGIGIDIGPNPASNLYFNVNIKNTKSYGMRAWVAVTNCKVEGTVSGTDNSGISFQAGVNGLKLRGIQGKNLCSDIAQVGIQVYATSAINFDVDVEGCTVDTCAGVPFEMDYITGFTYRGNKAIGSGLRGHSMRNLYDFTIQGNVARDQTIYGYEIQTFTRGVIIGNVAYNCDSGFSGQTALDVRIANNLVYKTNPTATNPHGIFLQTAGTKRVQIENNSLIDVAGQGIRLSAAPEDVVVRGNTLITTSAATLVSGGNLHAIIVHDWVRGVIEDNVITTALAGAGGANLGLIQISAAATDLRIRRNTIRSSTGSVLTVAGIAGSAVAASGLVIEDNEVSQLATGVYTATLTADDAIIGSNKIKNCTTPYSLKSTHIRRTKAAYEATAAPTAGTWEQGDLTWNSAPSSGNPVAWMCTVAGTPGTWMAINPIGTSTPTDIQSFTTSGTWTKPTGAKMVHGILISGGSGGGSGRRGAPGGARTGGAGGSAGARVVFDVAATELTATVAVTVGAGGAGGAGATVDDTDGNGGVSATASSFGDWRSYPGLSGTTTRGQLAVAATAGGSMPTLGANGGTSSATGGVGGIGVGGPYGGGGGAGGGITTTNTFSAGGNGSFPYHIASKSSTLGGTTAGANGAAGVTGTYTDQTGLGGGGGASDPAGAGGSGGNGGFPGGAGGGGGASVSGFVSGAGGNGAAGIVIIITSF